MARKRTKPSAKEPELFPSTTSFVTPEGVTISEIPLRTPTFGSKPNGQTLLDLIDLKRPRDAAGNPIGASHAAETEEIEVFGHAANTFFFAVPLLILLFWLDVLVHLQYKQDKDWSEVAWRCAKAFPAIYAIHYFFHPRRTWISVRLFLLALSIAAGCYVVTAVNRYGYYFVMKKTPPLGTLWIWAVIELDILGALASLLGVWTYAWYYGYPLW